LKRVSTPVRLAQLKGLMWRELISEVEHIGSPEAPNVELLIMIHPDFLSNRKGDQTEFRSSTGVWWNLLSFKNTNSFQRTE